MIVIQPELSKKCHNANELMIMTCYSYMRETISPGENKIKEPVHKITQFSASTITQLKFVGESCTGDN